MARLDEAVEEKLAARLEAGIKAEYLDKYIPQSKSNLYLKITPQNTA